MKMLTTLAPIRDGRTYRGMIRPASPGDVVELPDRYAARLVEIGSAELAGDPPKLAQVRKKTTTKKTPKR